LAERDNIIFTDGQKIENLKELSDIAADQHMKIIIYEDKVVMVKISSMNNTDVDKDNGPLHFNLSFA